MRCFEYRELSLEREGREAHAKEEALRSKEALLLLEETYVRVMKRPMPPLLRTSRGKPYFEGEGEPHFSLSHDGFVVACLLDTEGAVGLDVCLVAEGALAGGRYQRLLARFFTQEERQRIREAGSPEEAFFLLWSQKEAAVKATGEGLEALFADPSPQNGTRVESFFLSLSTGRYAVSVAQAPAAQ